MTGLLTPTHMLLLMAVLLLVFGAKRLPELGRSLGSGMREFRHSLASGADEARAALTVVPPAEPAADADEPPTGAAA